LATHNQIISTVDLGIQGAKALGKTIMGQTSPPVAPSAKFGDVKAQDDATARAAEAAARENSASVSPNEGTRRKHPHHSRSPWTARLRKHHGVQMNPQKELAELHLKRFKELKARRSTWESHWQEVIDFVLPRRGSVLGTNTPGDKRNPATLFNSTAIQSNELLAGALHGMLTNPATEFFGLVSGIKEVDQRDEVRKWLQQTTRELHTILHNSNFQTEISEVYLDLGSIGTAALSIEEDEKDVVRFRARFMGELYIAENSKGDIDTVYRCSQWSVRQLVQEYGIQNLGEKVQKLYQENPHQQVEVVECVYPRDEAERTKKAKVGPLTYPFGSLTILPMEPMVISESGYHEFPYAVPRWSKASGESYGRSPGMKVLADIKMINAMMKSTIEGAQLTIRPPLMVPDDGFMGAPRITPSGLNFYRAGTEDRIEPLLTNTRIDFGIQMLELISAVIREGFYIDQLQLRNGPQMTATEVNARNQQMLRLMGPVLARVDRELVRRVVDRVFGISRRQGRLPQPIPAALSGVNLRIQFTSQLAKAQKASELDNIVRIMQLIQPMIALDPSVADNFNGDEYVRFIMRASDGPQEVLHDEKDVSQIRKAKIDAAQAAREQQNQLGRAEIANKVAPLIAATQSGVKQ
jgi:hypothetical protein